MRNSVQAEMTPAKIKVSFDFFRLIAPKTPTKKM